MSISPEREWSEYARQQGRAFGPPVDDPETVPVQIVSPIYRSPDNPKDPGPSPFVVYTGKLTNTNIQVFQVMPVAAYDAVLLAVEDTGSPVGDVNTCEGFWGAKLGAGGVGNYDQAGGNVDLTLTPNFALRPFNKFGFIRFDLPLTDLPFWIHFRGASGTTFLISVTTMTLGY